MSQPVNYTPVTDFSEQEAINASGRSTVNTAALDTEFANIETTLDKVVMNLGMIQRDDGRLADLAVDVNTLSQDVLNLMGGFNLRGLYAEGEVYAINDICSDGPYTYVCTVAHTAGATINLSKFIQFGFTSGADAAQAAAAAQTSASNAATSETNAAASASSASSSVSSIGTSVSQAAGYAATATTKAGEASASATAASNSAAAAAASAAGIDTSNFATKNGSNVIGIWGISITGNASTATSAANGGVTTVNGNAGAISAAQIAAAATAGYGYTPASNASLVSSVNGNTGAISAAQISAAATTGYGYTPANGSLYLSKDIGASGNFPVGSFAYVDASAASITVGGTSTGANLTQAAGGLTLPGTWRNITNSVLGGGVLNFGMVQRIS